MSRKLLLLFLWLFTIPTHASFDPITRAMIEEGTKAYKRQAPYDTDYLEPLRFGKPLDAMKGARRSMLSTRFVRTNTGGIMPILVLNVITDMSGVIQFFQWDIRQSKESNFSEIDQHMFKTGEFLHYKGCRRLGSLMYTFKRSEPNKRMCYKRDIGYFEAPTDRIPYIYCSLDYYAVNYDYRNKGIGHAFVEELTRFVFQSTSADFIIAMVADDNVVSRRVLLNNKFLKAQSIIDRTAPGYDSAHCTGRSNVYISFDGEETFVQAGLSIGTTADFYLTRAGAPLKRIKSSL